ncbi:acyl carrier protein [Shivajiella indica]|uniref:Acyl carrier protein n=1 Tax=Shivajiella indica TaxID=872115 RepID=A0ABW5BBL7_9BACT
MGNYEKKKKAIGVFNSYGIPLTGKRKNANFYNELKMDSIYVDGLIFELEYQLNKELAADQISKVQSPSELLAVLI